MEEIEEVKEKSLVEKAEKLNAETLEKRKIESIARMLTHKAEEIARHERSMKNMDAEIKRLEEATLFNFDNECYDNRGSRF